MNITRSQAQVGDVTRRPLTCAPKWQTVSFRGIDLAFRRRVGTNAPSPARRQAQAARNSSQLTMSNSGLFLSPRKEPCNNFVLVIRPELAKPIRPEKYRDEDGGAENQKSPALIYVSPKQL